MMNHLVQSRDVTHRVDHFHGICIYVYLSIYLSIFMGPPVYQCGEHWSGGPGSLVRGAKEKLSIPR